MESRGFSQMKFVKDNFRTTLSNTNLSNLLHININGPSLQNFDPTNSIDNGTLKVDKSILENTIEMIVNN